MIGDWDESNCVLALAPNAWSKGNGDSDKNVGNMPSYPNGDYQNCVFTNMGTGYGYVYNGGDGYLRFDGVDDYIQTEYPVNISGETTNLTIEIKCNVTVGATRLFFGVKDDSNNSIQFYVFTDGTLRLVTKLVGVWKSIITSTTISSGEHTITCRIVNGIGEIYIDGVEASYSQQDTITNSRLFINKLRIGVQDTSSYFTEKMYWVAIYEEAISEARILTNHNLNKSLCLKGINTVDNMELKKIRYNILRFRRQIM